MLNFYAWIFVLLSWSLLFKMAICATGSKSKGFMISCIFVTCLQQKEKSTLLILHYLKLSALSIESALSIKGFDSQINQFNYLNYTFLRDIITTKLPEKLCVITHELVKILIPGVWGPPKARYNECAFTTCIDDLTLNIVQQS